MHMTEPIQTDANTTPKPSNKGVNTIYLLFLVIVML